MTNTNVSIINITIDHFSWIFGDSACRSDGAAGLLFSLGIVWSHLLLAVDRYLMTCNIAFRKNFDNINLTVTFFDK